MRVALVGLLVIGCTANTEKPVTTTQARELTNLEKYYPILPHRVRWYAVKDVESGALIDVISFAIMATETSSDGRVIYLIENRFSSGISLDYEEVTSEQVQLTRFVLLARNGDLKDVRFTPALPILRIPVKVGWVWTEGPHGSDQPYSFRAEAQLAMHVLGKDIEDCVRVVRTHVIVDRKTDYCAGVGIAGFDMLMPNDKWVRAELVAIAGETDLIAVKSSARVPGGCEYVFDPLGPSRGRTDRHRFSSGWVADDVSAPPEREHPRWRAGRRNPRTVAPGSQAASQNGAPDLLLVGHVPSQFPGASALARAEFDAPPGGSRARTCHAHRSRRRL
jgi:hypothetical protein